MKQTLLPAYTAALFCTLISSAALASLPEKSPHSLSVTSTKDAFYEQSNSPILASTTSHLEEKSAVPHKKSPFLTMLPMDALGEVAAFLDAESSANLSVTSHTLRNNILSNDPHTFRITSHTNLHLLGPLPQLYAYKRIMIEDDVSITRLTNLKEILQQARILDFSQNPTITDESLNLFLQSTDETGPALSHLKQLRFYGYTIPLENGMPQEINRTNHIETLLKHASDSHISTENTLDLLFMLLDPSIALGTLDTADRTQRAYELFTTLRQKKYLSPDEIFYTAHKLVFLEANLDQENGLQSAANRLSTFLHPAKTTENTLPFFAQSCDAYLTRRGKQATLEEYDITKRAYASIGRSGKKRCKELTSALLYKTGYGKFFFPEGMRNAQRNQVIQRFKNVPLNHLKALIACSTKLYRENTPMAEKYYIISYALSRTPLENLIYIAAYSDAFFTDSMLAEDYRAIIEMLEPLTIPQIKDLAQQALFFFTENTTNTQRIEDIQYLINESRARAERALAGPSFMSRLQALMCCS